mmetsp:Transcript_36934/g.56726  ORF Transcript_36934/g.56726 Transcript_36934/m.56726 type:complete len:305 (-) Transcript_36934:182-1096(-)|eukprot:CAMPEP_0118688910 /NCGR_PEP_ID=MMETSP0800-20121206/9178_1 /TAXON_ID=210618 ORGANISM="Striatella unipunctata, Strain CCMP2910" /NCGR_SAMPLE_ID=MMETSP0800 /ASSEMBLY_ACC=CAM_ASM_000638 /LENGTH=304 /DNA_ID=CAMNT_0006586213 /DNA_START=128 /DNA_END=1042 /DNA_ORIENTATION=+
MTSKRRSMQDDRDVASVVSQVSRESAIIFQNRPLDDTEKGIIRILHALHLAISRIVSLLVLRRQNEQAGCNTKKEKPSSIINSDEYDLDEDDAEEGLLMSEVRYGNRDDTDVYGQLTVSPSTSLTMSSTSTRTKKRVKKKKTPPKPSSATQRTNSMGSGVTAATEVIDLFAGHRFEGFEAQNRAAGFVKATSSRSLAREEALLTFFDRVDIDDIFNEQENSTKPNTDWFHDLREAAVEAGEEASKDINTDEFFFRLAQDNTATEQAVQDTFQTLTSDPWSSESDSSRLAPLGSLPEGKDSYRKA